MGTPKLDMPADAIRVSPSSFSFDYEDCRRCYWVAHVLGIKPMWKPMPKVFTTIDTAMRAHWQGRDFVNIDRMQTYRIDTARRRLQSTAHRRDGFPLGVYLSGETDAIAHNSHTSDTVEVWDFKTSSPKADNLAKYARAMEGYCYLLEHPLDPQRMAFRVERTRLVVFDPLEYAHDPRPDFDSGRRVLAGVETSHVMERAPEAFTAFLDDLLVLFNGPEPLRAPATCNQCRFEQIGYDRGMLAAERGAARLPAYPSLADPLPPSVLATGGPE